MIHPGPMTRRPKNEKQYIKYRQSQPKQKDICVFCESIEQQGGQILDDRKHCVIMENKFSYDIWDGCGVNEHIMIVPKSHVVSLGDLSPEEKIDYMNVLSEYESRGYSIYARAPENKTKTIAHQHTHLIKTDNKRKKWFFYIRKPHIMVVK